MWSIIRAFKRFDLLHKIGILCFTLCLFGCKETTPEFKLNTFVGPALGTTYQIKAYSEERLQLDSAIDSVFAVINQSMSTYIPASDISRINQGDTTVLVDANFREVFEKAQEVWQVTDGDFDPTVGALVNAWGFGPDKPLKEVTQAQVDSIMVFTGFDKVELGSDNRIVKQHPSLFLDFNALAKGFAIDVLGRMLKDRGVEHFLVEVGGEVLTQGKNLRRDQAWKVAIEDPTQSDGQRDLMATLSLTDGAMASSGNYRKSRTDPQTGEVYVHTINPKTGYTYRSNVLSTSVIAPTCMEADAYATAFMVMSVEESKEVLTRQSQLDAYILYTAADGTLQKFVTEGFQKRLVD